MKDSKKNKVSNFRFIDLFFIIFYFICFICFSLNFINIIDYKNQFFFLSGYTFPISIIFLWTKLINYKQLIFTKFPLSFKFSFRISLILQFSLQLTITILLNSQIIFFGRSSQFLFANLFILIWCVLSTIQKRSIRNKKKK
jgi:hypothetical protein